MLKLNLFGTTTAVLPASKCVVVLYNAAEEAKVMMIFVTKLQRLMMTTRTWKKKDSSLALVPFIKALQNTVLKICSQKSYFYKIMPRYFFFRLEENFSRISQSKKPISYSLMFQRDETFSLFFQHCAHSSILMRISVSLGN